MQSQAVGFDFLFYNDTLSSCSDYVVKQVSFFWQSDVFLTLVLF